MTAINERPMTADLDGALVLLCGRPVGGFIAAHQEWVDRREYGPAVARVSVSVGLTREDLVAALYQWRYTATFEELGRRENVRQLVAEAVVNGGLLDLADRRDEVEAVRPGTAAAAWLDSCRTAAADLIATSEAEASHNDRTGDVDETAAATEGARASSDAAESLRAGDDGDDKAAVDPAVYYYDPLAPVAGSVVPSEVVAGRPDADPFWQSAGRVADRSSRVDADAAAVDQPGPVGRKTRAEVDSDESIRGGAAQPNKSAGHAWSDEVEDAASPVTMDRAVVGEDPVWEDRDESGPVERPDDDPTAAAVGRARAALAELGSRRDADTGRAAPDEARDAQLDRWHVDDRAPDQDRAKHRAGVGDVAGWEL